jgi:hypothetical protein
MNFSLNKKKETDDGYVIREGLIFESGDYPDKNFQLSPEELLAASTDFRPAQVNLEHIKTIFDGKLGYLSNVRPSKDGSALYGEAKLPKWFDDIFSDEPIKVSCEWDRNTKTIQGLALTTRPRIKDAILMSKFNESLISNGDTPIVAFNESLAAFGLKFCDDMLEMETEYDTDKTWTGYDVMQSIHDMCARTGAVCVGETEEEDADFISKKESELIQKMHDASITGGAKCNFMPANYSETEKDKMNPIEKIKAKFNEWVAEVEKETETPVETGNKDLEAKFAELELSVKAEKEALEAKFSALIETAKTEKEALEVKAQELEAALTAKTAEVESFSANKTADAANASKENAKLKVEELVKAGKVLPAKQEQLEAIFSVLIDGNSTVNFNDTTTNAVDVLFNLFDGVVSLKEEIPTEGAALNNNTATDDAAEIEAAKERARVWAKKMSKK